MKNILRKPYLLFVLTALLMSAIFIFVPVKFFDSELHYQTELQDFTVVEKLPLGYYLGIGIDQDELEASGLKSFKLTSAGALLVAIMLVGIPGMLGYRSYLANFNRKNKEQEKQ